MTTITKEEVKAFIEQIESDLSNGWEAQIFELKLARIALASLEAEKGADPVVFTDERNLHHIAMGRETSLIWGKQNQEVGDIPLYRHAPPAPAVIQSSQLLHDFYRAYADWLISGGDGQFSCVNGLCANLFDYCDRKGVGSAQALNEMHVQFVTAGMNEKLPFNTSVTDFDAESADGKCHLNTARRKWVFRRIIDGVKPAPVVPLSITLPDTSSKAFWSGTGKKEVFHPETYKRWVKEAIERFCMIAGIAVEVKS